MTWSTLKRTTPLRSNGTGLRRTPFKRKPVALLPKKVEEKAKAGKETAHRAKRRDKVDIAKRLDMVFSAFVRLRDAMYGGNTVCISCGRVLPFEQMQCGHYISRKNMATRWDEDNCHSECTIDNCSNPNHLEGYKQNLINKIGLERFENVIRKSKGIKKYGNEELIEMIKHYTAEVRRLSNEKGIRVNI